MATALKEYAIACEILIQTGVRISLQLLSRRIEYPWLDLDYAPSRLAVLAK
jgi:hypothetical protein